MPPPRRLRVPIHPGELTRRNATSLLNKLAEANFDTISGQIIALVNQSAAKDDSGKISMVSQTCLHAAVAQTLRVDLYARLCRVVLEQSSTLLHGSGPRTSEGKTMAAGEAFIYYLLNPLYRRVETGCPSRDSSDTSKGRYLVNVKFLADLFLEDMVTKAKMHECIGELLSAGTFASQIDLEALCVILKTSGSWLDAPAARVQMDIYFERIEELKQSTLILARTRFMLQDICDLRTRGWIERAHFAELSLPPPIDVVLRSATDEHLSLPSAVMSASSTALKDEVPLGSGAIHNLTPILDAPGLGGDGNDTTNQANSRPNDLPHPYLILVTPSTTTTLLEAISAALSLPPSTNLSGGQFPRSTLEDWVVRISALTADLTTRRAEVQDLKADMKRMSLHTGVLESLLNSARVQYDWKEMQNTMQEATVERLTGQLSASVETNKKLTQERDILEKTRNAEHKATVERLAGQLSASVESNGRLTQERFDFMTSWVTERATVARMSAELAASVERIEELTQERDILEKTQNADQKVTVERLTGQLAASVQKNQNLTRERDTFRAAWIKERATVDRMSGDLAASVETIERLTRERDILEKTRNAKQMHRTEVQTELRAAQSMALKSAEDLRKSRDHCVDLAAQLARAKQELQVQKDAEGARTSAARKDGEEAARNQMMQFLHSKQEDAERARQAEEDRIKTEEEEKVRREREATRKVERQVGADRERLRCLKRDEKYRNAAPWTDVLAVERFEKVLILEEFARYKFSDSAPLTFGALPWPVLNRPGIYNTGHITAQSVRAFFTAPALLSVSSAVYPVPADYRKYLIKQGLLAFHGDKMVSRISTVDDPSMRQQIHDAANIVTQTLNDLIR